MTKANVLCRTESTRTVYHQIPIHSLPHQPTHPQPITPKHKTKLRLEVRDLSCDASKSFLSLVEAGTVLEDSIASVLGLLYTPHSKLPTTRSVTLILRAFDGVAYTTGSDLDDDHKEIHLSTDYLQNVSKDRHRKEILGVIRHEMVHCWQWNGKGTCPGGLIEGIADYVRLRANLGPPHWKREWKDCEWDVGYQRTGYFLDYLERRFGYGTVIRLNERLRDHEYDEKSYWMHCCGIDVKTLWKEYGISCDKEFGNKGYHEENSTT